MYHQGGIRAYGAPMMIIKHPFGHLVGMPPRPRVPRNPHKAGTAQYAAWQKAFDETSAYIAAARRRGETYAAIEHFVRTGEELPEAAPVDAPALPSPKPPHVPQAVLDAVRAAARAVVDPASSPYAHLADVVPIKGEHKAQVSNAQAAARLYYGLEPPPATGMAAAILRAAELARGTTDLTAPAPPDPNSKNRAEAFAARVIECGRRARGEIE